MTDRLSSQLLHLLPMRRRVFGISQSNKLELMEGLAQSEIAGSYSS